jgi:hypothetical protein
VGLDAWVNCDCFERGRLRTPARPEWRVYVDDDGGRATANTDLDQQIAFDSWDREACEHESGQLLHHYVGNISLIGLFRQLLLPMVDRIPIITTKVIYSGTHCGDRLALDEVTRLAEEINVLSQVHGENLRDEQFLRHFEQQLRELVECSLRVRKPIVF